MRTVDGFVRQIYERPFSRHRPILLPRPRRDAVHRDKGTAQPIRKMKRAVRRLLRVVIARSRRSPSATLRPRWSFNGAMRCPSRPSTVPMCQHLLNSPGSVPVDPTPNALVTDAHPLGHVRHRIPPSHEPDRMKPHAVLMIDLVQITLSKRLFAVLPVDFERTSHMRYRESDLSERHAC